MGDFTQPQQKYAGTSENSNIGTSMRRSSGRRSTTGNDVVATIIISLFFSPSQPFLIEGVLGSKNLFSKSCLEYPKT